MITRFWAETGTAFATLLFGVVIVYGALDFGVGWDTSGPQPGAFPFYIGLLVALASLGTLLQAVVQRAAGNASLREEILDRARAKRVASFFLPLLGFVVLSVTVGMYVGTILYIIFAMRFQGSYGWPAALATASCTAAFFYLALEKFFQIGLLKGPLEPLIGL